jgi:hypothetical protein
MLCRHRTNFGLQKLDDAQVLHARNVSLSPISAAWIISVPWSIEATFFRIVQECLTRETRQQITLDFIH